jgi:hypothetical protein
MRLLEFKRGEVVRESVVGGVFEVYRIMLVKCSMSAAQKGLLPGTEYTDILESEAMLLVEDWSSVCKVVVVLVKGC